MRGGLLAAGLVTAALAACGEDEAAAPEPTRTATPTPTSTPAADKPPKRATSVRGCLRIWNRDEVRGSTSQVSATDFLADLARKGRTPVQVAYRKPSCLVVAPIGGRRIAVFVTVRNHAFYDLPERQSLPAGREIAYNARATRDGRIVLDG